MRHLRLRLSPCVAAGCPAGRAARGTACLARVIGLITLPAPVYDISGGGVQPWRRSAYGGGAERPLPDVTVPVRGQPSDSPGSGAGEQPPLEWGTTALWRLLWGLLQPPLEAMHTHLQRHSPSSWQLPFPHVAQGILQFRPCGRPGIGSPYSFGIQGDWIAPTAGSPVQLAKQTTRASSGPASDTFFTTQMPWRVSYGYGHSTVQSGPVQPFGLSAGCPGPSH